VSTAAHITPRVRVAAGDGRCARVDRPLGLRFSGLTRARPAQRVRRDGNRGRKGTVRWPKD
jgi:hypothetical protein